MDISTKVILAVVGIFFTILMISSINTHMKYEEKGERMDCEYLGSPRDLGSVRFFDCSGEIKMERTK